MADSESLSLSTFFCLPQDPDALIGQGVSSFRHGLHFLAATTIKVGAVRPATALALALTRGYCELAAGASS